MGAIAEIKKAIISIIITQIVFAGHFLNVKFFHDEYEMTSKIYQNRQIQSNAHFKDWLTQISSR